jgi:arsenate reductase (thioredoxin)
MDATAVLKRRIELMPALPMSSLAAMSLQRELDQIGKAGA